MAVATSPRAGLPGGPGEPRVVQAYRYTFRFHELTAEQHRRHGPTWTLRLPGLPDSVVTTDRELIRHVLTGDPLKRRHANDIIAPVLGDESVMVLEPARHLHRRKLLLPPFHGERIAGYRDVVREAVEANLDRWPAAGEVGVHEHVREITLDVIQSAVLGSRDPAFAAELTALMKTFNSPLANFGMFAPQFNKRARWNVIAEPFWRERDKFDALMARLIDAARHDPALEHRDDVLALLALATDEDGGRLTDTQLNDELKTLLSAGHETTATAIGWAADLLAHRPEAAEAIRGGDRAYLAAAAKEVLRLRTITPICFARTLLEPTHGLHAGVVVLGDAHSLHHDPELHPDPEAFRPERFLDGNPAPYSYLPFGGGAHRCLGAALANLELETALDVLTERFDLFPAGPPAKAERRGPTMIPSGGAKVRVRRR